MSRPSAPRDQRQPSPIVRARRPRLGLPIAALVIALIAGGAAPAGDEVTLGSSVVGFGHLAETATPEPFETDEAYRRLLRDRFTSLTPENQLKWEVVHPERDRFEFGPADRIIEFAQDHDMALRGHTLMWHAQNPSWLTNGDFTDDELRDILREHILTVLGRYAGRIGEWDVANELFDDAGEVRTENPFVGRLGVGIVADAFRWAHQADPDAVLFLNEGSGHHVPGGPDAEASLRRGQRSAGSRSRLT